MNKREKMLAVVAIVLVVLMGAKHFYGSYRIALESRRADVRTAEAKKQDAHLKVIDGHHAVHQMTIWQDRSLPNNDRAFSLYKAWLLDKAKSAGLSTSDIKLSPTSSSSTAYTAIGYNIVATGSLSAVTSFLYEFYHSPQLHQITRLQLTRPPGSPLLNVNLDVEALSLRGAVTTDKLPTGDSKRLKLANADAYKKSLGERDLVAVYSPAPPPGPPRVRPTPTGPPKFDDAEEAFFSGTVNNGNGYQAWINVRTTGETLHLAAGDPVKVGALEGEIVSVEPRLLVFKSGDKKFQVALGQSLRKGKEIAGDGAAKSKSAEAPPKS